jgi:hypothetical protein
MPFFMDLAADDELDLYFVVSQVHMQGILFVFKPWLKACDTQEESNSGSSIDWRKAHTGSRDGCYNSTQTGPSAVLAIKTNGVFAKIRGEKAWWAFISWQIWICSIVKPFWLSLTKRQGVIIVMNEEQQIELPIITPHWLHQLAPNVDNVRQPIIQISASRIFVTIAEATGGAKKTQSIMMLASASE